MSHDFLPTTKQPGDVPAPSHELERVAPTTPDTLEGGEDNPEVANIMQLLLERGEAVTPGTQVIESPFGEDEKLYDVTRFYGVETRLPEGIARYTVRAYKTKFTDEHRAMISAMREKAGLSPDSHEDFFDEQNSTGILVVSSWNDEANGEPRKIEATLNYSQPNGGTGMAMRTMSETIPPNVPEALISPFVTPIKLAGEPLSLEDAREEGNATRKNFESTPEDTPLRRALGRFGIRRRK